MGKSSPTRTGPRIFRRTIPSNILKVAASVLNSILCAIKKLGENDRLVEVPIETIVAPVGKSDPVLDLKIDIIFCGNVKKNKLLNYIESVVISRNLGFNKPHVGNIAIYSRLHQNMTHP